jgi:hypothetical protein
MTPLCGWRRRKTSSSKIPVIGDQDAAFPLRDGKHLPIREAWGILSSDTDGVMTMIGEPTNEAGICALVQEKLHKLVGGAPRGARLRPTAF